MNFQPGQSGNPASRPLALELPKVSCAEEAQVALDTVIEAFGRGAITVREFSPMLGSLDRMARVAERVQQNRASSELTGEYRRSPADGAAEAATAVGDALYSPVNSGAIGERSPAWEERPALDDGSRVVAALSTGDGEREPLYVNPG